MKNSPYELRFERSLNSNFLQLADIVVYNVYRQFIDFGGVTEKAYHYFKKIFSDTKNPPSGGAFVVSSRKSTIIH